MPRRKQDFSYMDAAFELPPDVDPRMVELYNVLIHELREESRGLPMTTNQQMLIDMIASSYVVLKDMLHKGQIRSSTAVKDQLSQWISLLQEFNKQQSRKTPDEYRAAIMTEVRQIIAEELGSIRDKKTREMLTSKFVDAFAEAGF